MKECSARATFSLASRQATHILKERDNILWKATIPLPGYQRRSHPIVRNDTLSCLYLSRSFISILFRSAICVLYVVSHQRDSWGLRSALSDSGSRYLLDMLSQRRSLIYFSNGTTFILLYDAIYLLLAFAAGASGANMFRSGV